MHLNDIENIKRLAIFAYYDKDGVIDDYVVFLLKAMKKHCTEQIVVVNGFLNSESEERIKPQCSKIIYRENNGFDITAYKQGLAEAENIEKYDEILFYNQTIFGPVCSLQTMFSAMAQRNLDFWGLTRHKGAQKASWDTSVPIAPHIQSYFFAVRRSMFETEAFKTYWENLPQINSYWDAVSKHEVVFTQHFANLGFSWDSYLHTSDLEPYNDYPMMGMPVEVLRRKSPFFKRKSFLSQRHSYTTIPQGSAPQMLYDYIRTQTDYPVKFINQNLHRTVEPALIHDALTLSFDTSTPVNKPFRTVAVIWFANEYLGENLCKAAANIQKDASILCVFASEAIHEKFATKLPPKTQCIVTEENGITHLFGALWKNLSVFEYILYINNGMPLLLDEFYDATTLENAISCLVPSSCGEILSQRDDIGVFVAPFSIHQECLSLGLNWKESAKFLKPHLDKINVTAPYGEMPIGFAVRGNMFFARTSAVSEFSKFEFCNEMFEGLYPHSEFLLPIVAQNAGYHTATAFSKEQAFVMLENNEALLREMTKKWATNRMVRSDQVLFRMQGVLDFYYERRFHMTLEQAFTAKLSFKEKLWICMQIMLSQETFAKIKKVLGKAETKEVPQIEDTLE